jgi:hypothetical protein
VRELAEAQRRTDAQLAELAEAQARTETRLAELSAAQARTEARVAELAEAQARTDTQVAGLIEAQQDLRDQVADLLVQMSAVTQHLGRLDGRVDGLEIRLGALQGTDLERRYRERAGAYFDDLVRRARPLSPSEVGLLLDAPDTAAQFAPEERRDVLLADLVVRGCRVQDQAEVYLVVEISVGIGPDDVERAVRRAGLLGRVVTALPAVAGGSITAEAAALAEERGVWQVLDGQIEALAGA